jgi:hypothetical protein
MAVGDHKVKDQAMAAYMKAHPGAFPDSVMRPHGGCGAADRGLASQMGHVTNNTSKWQHAMLAGVIFYRLGMGSGGIPAELL